MAAPAPMLLVENRSASDISQDHLKAPLDRLLARFTYEDGALLVQIPQVPLDLLEPEVARNRGYFAYPPQGLLYLSAALRAQGVETQIVDLNLVVLAEAQTDKPCIEAAWQDALDQALAVFEQPFVCVSFMFDATFPEFKRVCEYIRLKRPHACIAAGGVSATGDPDRLLRDGLVDLVFSHEGEQTLDSFYAYLRGRSMSLPLNLTFSDEVGLPLATEKATGSDVNVDIRGEYGRIPIRDYHKVGSLSNFSRMNGVDVPFATVLSRRGCRAHCSFCGVRNFNGVSVRVRGVNSVLDEMEHLCQQYGIRHFDWLDDDLLFDREAALELFDSMSRRLPGITWAANNGLIAAAITPEVMDAMERSGCIGFKVGLESGNSTVLRNVHKPTRLDKFFAFAEMAGAYPGMFVAVNFIMGFPREQCGQMLDSFKAALQAKLDWNNFYLYQHIKNTELFMSYGGLGGDLPAEHGKDAQGPNMNPVRGGVFKNYRPQQGVLSGYDILDLPRDLDPCKAQLQENWFTFNYVANFLRMPALFTNSEKRLRNAIRWMRVLSQAYPEDAAMSCVAYYLERRLADTPLQVLDGLRRAAVVKLKRSEYWRFRDGQFGFSAFLDGVIPALDTRVEALPLTELMKEAGRC